MVTILSLSDHQFITNMNTHSGQSPTRAHGARHLAQVSRWLQRMCRLHPEVSCKEDEVIQLTQSQLTLADDLRPDFYAGRKLGEVEQALMWSVLQEEPECPSRVLLDKAAQRQILIAVSLRQINRWRVTWHTPEAKR